MELKFVDRTRNLNFVFPFPNDFKRVNGCGKVKKITDAKGHDAHYITQYNSRTKVQETMNCIDKVMSEIFDGMFVNFIELWNPSTGVRETHAWNPEEYLAFIVNDDGKTIDKL